MSIPFDNRYPYLWRVSDAPQRVRKQVVKIAGDVCRRTGLNACWNVRLGRVHFYTADPGTGVFGLEMFQAGSADPIRWDNSDVDELCRMLNYRKMSARAKDRVTSQKEQSKEWKAQEAVDRHCDERRPDALDYAGFLDKRRRGVGKVISTL